MPTYQITLTPGNSFEITIDGHEGLIIVDHPLKGPANVLVTQDSSASTRLFQFQPLPEVRAPEARKEHHG